MTRLIIMVSLLVSLIFITGCGRKTAPVYSEKGSADTAEEVNNKK